MGRQRAVACAIGAARALRWTPPPSSLYLCTDLLDPLDRTPAHSRTTNHIATMAAIDVPEDAPQPSPEVLKKLETAREKKEVGDKAFKAGDLKSGMSTSTS